MSIFIHAFIRRHIMQIKEYRTLLDEWKTPILKETAHYNIDGRKKIHNSEDIYDFCRDHLELDKRTEEYCYCICFPSIRC